MISKPMIDAQAINQSVDVSAIANKLNTLMDETGITSKILSESTGISVAAINNLKRGEGNPTLGTLNALASFFGLSLLQMLGFDANNQQQNNASIVPLFDLRSAHMRTSDLIVSRFLVEITNAAKHKSYFGVILTNNSLLPFYEKSTLFILSDEIDTIDGDIVLVRIQNHVNALKRVYIKNNKYYLKNINLDENLDSYNINDVKILGIVVQIIQRTI